MRDPHIEKRKIDGRWELVLVVPPEDSAAATARKVAAARLKFGSSSVHHVEVEQTDEAAEQLAQARCKRLRKAGILP